jgi:hypothetical protein
MQMSEGRDYWAAFPVDRPRGSQTRRLASPAGDMRQTNGGVGQAFGDAVLPSDHASALHAAVHELIDQFCQDGATLLETPEKVQETVNEPLRAQLRPRL